MKKVFLFLAVASSFSLASCKKDRTCTCTDAAGDKIVVVFKKATKSGTNCYDQTITSGGTVFVLNCKLD